MQVQGQPQQRSLPNIHNKDDKYASHFASIVKSLSHKFFGSIVKSAFVSLQTPVTSRPIPPLQCIVFLQPLK